MIVLEFIVVLFLGLLLVLFVCKCAIVLIREKRNHKAEEIELATTQTSHEETVSLNQSLLE